MPNTPETPSLLLRLRHETRPAHDALEQNAFTQALTAGTLTAAGTAQFLAKLYGFLRPFETALHAYAADFSPAWELPQRRRAHLIWEDIKNSGEPTDAAALPLCPALPPLHTRPQLLGAMYVLEGSTLGGQFITKQLAQAGIPLRRYFTGHGPRTGARWQSFCQLLTDTAAPADHDDIVASARLTFTRLDQWINQP